ELARIVCGSVRGLAEERAWHLRELARPASPVAAIGSLEGVTDERAWRWREQYVLHAPRPVMRTIAGVDHPQAWMLREAAGPRRPAGIPQPDATCRSRSAAAGPGA